MARPNFFIVGAPRSGTTALSHYLKQHPDIFIPDRKEMHHFGPDLNLNSPFEDDIAYLSEFEGATDEKRVGEASVYYIYSKLAPAQIKQFEPSAKIIIMLRNPVDMIYSLHNRFVINGYDDIADFRAALEAEPDRKQGKRIPEHFEAPRFLIYRDNAKYSEHVKRYLEAFDPENIHVIIYDDFKNDTPKSYADTLAFLEVSKNFRPGFKIINQTRQVRSSALASMLFFPPGFILALEKKSPLARKRYLRKILYKLNTPKKPLAPMDPRLRRKLQAELAPDVERLSSILGRDLTHWTREKK